MKRIARVVAEIAGYVVVLADHLLIRLMAAYSL
jgi:hypothetical protein